MHLITETLLVGNINDAKDPPAKIGALLLVAAEYKLEAPGWLLSGRIPFSEYAEAMPLLLDQAVSWVEQHMSDRRVMVCCRAGMGRSVSVVMAYLCCVEGMTYADVLSLVMRRRPGAMPLPKLEEAIAQVRLLREARATDKKNLPSR
ncbi:MAG: dual specificity protein phosphatase family protein [Nitrospiraceae bacterium]|jgi:protein-tyrosine phosphatase|nr:dual specificity protein phosphatase family protein [Nitrospiraceae bacterium]